MSVHLSWVDSHCHLDAPEFANTITQIIDAAEKKEVKAILIPTVRAKDADAVRDIASRFAKNIPGLVYALGIHPLFIHEAQESDVDILRQHIQASLSDSRFVGIGEIGLDYFVEGLDPKRQEFFLNAQLDLAQEFGLPVVLHVRRSQDALLKALRHRKIPGGIAHAFNGSFQQADQFIELGFKLGFGGAATYERALQIRRLLKELPIESIVTETDSPDIPPAWLRDEGLQYNEPAFLPRIARELAVIRGMDEAEFASITWRNAMSAFPRWSALLVTSNNPIAS